MLDQELELENKTPSIEQPRETLKLPETDKSKEVFDIDKIDSMSEEEKYKEALRVGLIPKEDFKGDPTRWKDPDTFLRETYQKLPALRNVIKKDREVIEVQNVLIRNKIKENEKLKRDLESEKLNNQRKIEESLNDNNLNEYHNLTRRNQTIESDIEDVRAQSEELEKVASKIEVENNPENKAVALEDQIATQNWLSLNPHYKVNYEEISTTEELSFRKEADKHFRHYKQNYPDAPLHQIYKAVDAQLQRSGLKKQSAGTYNFTPPNNNAPAKTRDYNSLSRSAKINCDRFVRSGVDQQSYIDNLDDESFAWYKS